MSFKDDLKRKNETISLDQEVYQLEGIVDKFKSTERTRERFFQCFQKALRCANHAGIPVTGYKDDRQIKDIFNDVKLNNLQKVFSLKIDLRADDSLIEALLEEFKRAALQRAKELKAVARDEFKACADLVFWDEFRKRQQISEDLLTQTEQALVAYKMRAKDERCTLLAMASELGINYNSHSEKESKAAEKKVGRMLKWGEKMVRAAANGTFSKAICEPKK